MRPFGSKKWKNLYDQFIGSGWNSLERWGLAYLHSPDALKKLSIAIAHAYSKASRSVEISIQSIWIDGTPQAEGYTAVGSTIKCELADLLFIFNEIDASGKVAHRRGVLIQGKTANKYNKLPSGNSTKKERKLLEQLDRKKPLNLYKDVSATRSSKIGTYIFGGSNAGIGDYARYLLMPKARFWRHTPCPPICPICATTAPFQVGWPASLRKTELKSLHSFVQTFQMLALEKSIGSEIQDKSSAIPCDWSKMVWDLLQDYGDVIMKGYGGQRRINQSQNVLSFSVFHSINGSKIVPVPPAIFGRRYEDMERPPLISVINVDVRNID